jgi:hypothetical protein
MCSSAALFCTAETLPAGAECTSIGHILWGVEEPEWLGLGVLVPLGSARKTPDSALWAAQPACLVL